MTSSAVLTEQTTSAESVAATTRELIDGAFYIKKQRWGTFVSYGEDGTPLITSLTEELCLSATRFYLKGLQEGWGEQETKTYDSYVGGKL